jgi:hypothetical protein
VVFLAAHKRDGKALCAKPACTADSVEVAVGIAGHIVVEDDVDLLDIDTTTEDISGYHDSVLEGLKICVALDPLVLLETTVDRDRWEVLLFENMIEHLSALHRLDENDHLVELKTVEKVCQLLDLFFLLEFDEVLLQTMEGELALVVDEDFVLVTHELTADLLNFVGHGGAEHHHLLLGRSCLENGLHVTTHVCIAY